MRAKYIVYVLPIDDVIDLGLAPFVLRVLDEATQAGAAAMILEIEDFGGRMDVAAQIRDALLNTPLRTVGFVKKRAKSAAALSGLVTQKLVMATGRTIGALAPVLAGAPDVESKPAEHKHLSGQRAPRPCLGSAGAVFAGWPHTRSAHVAGCRRHRCHPQSLSRTATARA